jgi:hypothetical protein
MSNEPGDFNIKLNRFMMQYRITPHTTKVEQKGTLHYLNVVDGTEHTRHVNQMRATGCQGTNDYTDTTFINCYDSSNTNKNNASAGKRSMSADLSHLSSRRSLNTSQLIIRRSLHVPPPTIIK